MKNNTRILTLIPVALVVLYAFYFTGIAEYGPLDVKSSSFSGGVIKT